MGPFWSFECGWRDPEGLYKGMDPKVADHLEWKLPSLLPSRTRQQATRRLGRSLLMKVK